MKEEMYLTTFELLHTSGFIKLMSIIWMPLAMYLITIWICKKIKIG